MILLSPELFGSTNENLPPTTRPNNTRTNNKAMERCYAGEGRTVKLPISRRNDNLGTPASFPETTKSISAREKDRIILRDYRKRIIMSEKKTAEEYKALGNEAFSKKDFKTAIDFYTKAILQDPSNHIFFSNRSASHAGLQEWESAIKDAKECIRLNPEFIKGYYRLATAQLESKDYDAAEATIKQGLGLDANHTQLLKLLRNVKLYRKAATSSVATSGGNANRQLDTATTRELYDLQVQYGNTAREYNTVKANLTKAAREERMYGLTLSEVKENPSVSGDYFRSVGKLFMRSSQSDILKHLENNIENQKKKQQELTGKSDYLEKRLKSQQMNMKELAGQ